MWSVLESSSASRLVLRSSLLSSVKKQPPSLVTTPSLRRRRFFSENSSPSSAKRGSGGTKRDEIGEFSILYPIVGGFIVAIGGGIKYVHDHVEGTEGLQRSLSFYKFAIPKYVQYRWHMFLQSPDEVWNQLDKETAATALDVAYELEGFYIKGGQMVAANIGNAFPKIWQDTMTVLQDQVPPQKFSVIKEIVSSELDFDNVFATFEESPIGSAAIGQVRERTCKRK